MDSRQRVTKLMIDHREEAFARAVQLLHLIQQPGALLVMTCVLHGRGSFRRQEHSNVLIFLGEYVSAGLAVQVQVPKHALRSE